MAEKPGAGIEKKCERTDKQSRAFIKIVGDLIPTSPKEWERAGSRLIKWSMKHKRPKPDVTMLYNKFVGLVLGRGTSNDIEPLELQKLALPAWERIQSKKERQLSQEQHGSISPDSHVNMEDNEIAPVHEKGGSQASEEADEDFGETVPVDSYSSSGTTTEEEITKLEVGDFDKLLTERSDGTTTGKKKPRDTNSVVEITRKFSGMLRLTLDALGCEGSVATINEILEMFTEMMRLVLKTQHSFLLSKRFPGRISKHVIAGIVRDELSDELQKIFKAISGIENQLGTSCRRVRLGNRPLEIVKDNSESK